MKKITSLIRHKNVGLLILRVFVGAIFLVHGIQKFVNLEPMTMFFTQIGLNSFWLYTVATFETLGGALLILGLFTRYAAMSLAIIMVGAIYFFKWQIGGDTWLGRFAAAEIDLALLGANLALIFTGGGMFSLAGACKHKCHDNGAACNLCDVVGCDDDKCCGSASGTTETRI